MKKSTPLGIIFLVVFIDLIGFGIVLPLLPIYARSYGASPFVIGLLAVSYSGTQFLFNPVWGRVSDHVGRRPIILMSLTGSVISYAVFGWAPSLVWLFISRLSAGLFGANISTAMAFIADVTTPENRAKGMGLIGAAFGLGFIFGPALGGFLSKYSYSLPGYGASLLSLIALLLAMFQLPESYQPQQKPRKPTEFPLLEQLKPLVQAVKQSELARPLLVYFLVVFAFANMQMTFPLFTQEVYNFDVEHNGYLFAFIGLISAGLQGGAIGMLSKKFGEGALAIWGTGLSMIGLSAIPLAKTVPILVIFMTVLGIGTGLNTPTLTTMVSLGTDETMQGGMMGVNRAVSSLARILGPLWGGWTYQALGINWPYWTGGLALLLAFLVGWPLRHYASSKKKKPVKIQEPVE